MPNTPTPNLGLTVPTVGSDINIWGNELNSDLAILDSLAVCVVVNASSSFNAPANNSVETFIRCTTGNLTITINIPAPATCVGKIFTVKKIDPGLGTVSITPLSGTIDGQATYNITNQYAFVRLMSNGVSYDVIAA